MLPEYVEYWEKNKPACVGLSRIGKGRWNVVLASGTSRECSILWSLVPSKWISHNRRGICLKWFRDCPIKTNPNSFVWILFRDKLRGK